jgi:hypothetical protein
MNPLIPFDPPKADFAVQLFEILEGIDSEEISEIPKGPLDSSFLIGPVRVTQMDGKTEMSCEVQKLGIELQLGTSFDDDRLNVVIPMVMGHASHLSMGLDMALQKELQILPGIKPDIKVSGVGQNHGKSISHSPGKTLLDPIDLSGLSGEKCQLMVGLPLLLAVLLGIDRNCGVTSLKVVGLEPPIDLRGF